MAGTEIKTVTGTVISGINKIKCRTGNSITDGHTAFYGQMTALVLIKQTRLGPETSGDRLPFSNDDRDALNLGCYYSLALGQGSYYHEGLYGPLPALGTDYRCLLFASIVEDKKQQDPRMAGKNYVLVCFFYHEQLEEAVNNSRAELDKALKSYFNSNGSLPAIEGNWGVLKVMLQNYIYCTDVCLRNGINSGESGRTG